MMQQISEVGVYIDSSVEVENGIAIEANCSVLSKDFINNTHLKTIIKSGARIRAGSTIYPGVTIHSNAIVMPGSVVTRSVPPLAIVQGNPATIIGYKSTYIQNDVKIQQHTESKVAVIASKVVNVTFHNLPLISDLRGDLSVGEFERQVPFSVKRYFLVLSVPTAETRGEHAHKKCQQFLICVKGSCKVIADDGKNREEFILDQPNKGLYLPSMTWGIQYQYSQDAVLLVFASDYYDNSDYIRDYDDFMKLTHKPQS